MEEKDKFEVEKLILEAKLETSESRLKLVITIAGALLGVFGIIIPLFISITSNQQVQNANERVDKAIVKMENSFKELADAQSRKPDIECYFEGKKLENSTLSFDYNKNYYFEVRNTGDATAKNFQFYFYIPDVQDNDIYLLHDWENIGKPSDVPVFSDLYKYMFPIDYLNPKETLRVLFNFTTRHGKECKASVLLKIYYGQPEPKTFPFEIVIREREVK